MENPTLVWQRASAEDLKPGKIVVVRYGPKWIYTLQLNDNNIMWLIERKIQCIILPE